MLRLRLITPLSDEAFFMNLIMEVLRLFQYYYSYVQYSLGMFM